MTWTGWSGWTKFVDEDTKLYVTDEHGQEVPILGVTYQMGGSLIIKVKVVEK